MADAKNDSTQQFPPVVSVLGHVDHGKTTLLDTIRKTSIAEREQGGITQKIGASDVEVVHDGIKRRITFIDTPGHEAFAQMRGRGAKVADIGILVVASTDGLMPQTKESIALLKASQIPFIVALTKADLPTKQTEKVKQQLAGEGIMLEGLGGDVPYIEVSAKTNLNIKELLDLILLIHDMRAKTQEISSNSPLEAIVIESRLDAKAGPKASVVIKNGKLQLRQELIYGDQALKVKSIMNPQGKLVSEATVGDAVEILGFTTVPNVGAIITNKGEQQAEVAALKKEPAGEYNPNAPEGSISVIIATDTQGSLEAILESLPKEDIVIVLKKTGDVTESDILLAKSTRSLVLGFNIKIRPEVQKLAITEKVLVRNYSIIYNMLDEVNDVLEGKKLEGVEQVYGVADIIARFPFEKTFALGVKVQDGRIAKGDKARVMRGETIIGESTISSLRLGKNPISRVEKGNEAGVVLASKLDFQAGDMLISHA